MSEKQQKANPFDLAAGVPGIDGALRPTPKFADRISKRVLAVAGAVVLIILGLFFISIDQMDAPKAKAPEVKPETVKKQSESRTREANSDLPDDLLGADAGAGTQRGTSLVKAAELPPASAAGANSAATVSAVATGAKANGSVVPPIGPADPNAVGGGAGDMAGRSVPPLTPEQQAKNQAQQDRFARMKKAKEGSLMAKGFDVENVGPQATAAPTAGLTAGGNVGDLLSAAAKGNALQAALAAPKSDSEQDEKRDFISNASKEDRGYHPHVPLPALSPNEVKTGSYIPMALEQGINSDLPGQITARVTDPVYDSVSGCRLLIPPMSKAVGRYDSKIAIGQGRMLVVWNALIFPDGSELNLAGMQGYDTAGQAGLESDVDNHYWRLFGLTFGMSMITSGVQLSVPQPNPTTSGAAAQQTPAQIIAASLAQQYGNLGAQILGKYMAVQPTLRNSPGERFMIMVPKTMVFSKVWRNRCSGK